jgi:hypothetical protein
MTLETTRSVTGTMRCDTRLEMVAQPVPTLWARIKTFIVSTFTTKRK